MRRATFMPCRLSGWAALPGRILTLSRGQLAYASSLSAIHQGIHQSSRVEPGSSNARLRDAERSKGTQRQKEKQDEQGQKAKKSRAARFHDPDDPFGKRSLVWQLKHGELGKQAAALEQSGRGDADPFSALSAAASPASSSGSRRSVRAADTRHPAKIPYTTAASQFLYGRSVVSAALSTQRRRLYRLYVWKPHDGGRDGKGKSKFARRAANDPLARRAKALGVRVRPLGGPDGLRLMDRMAGGRPHNGFVLEASPLPMPPLDGLGPVAVPERGLEGGEGEEMVPRTPAAPKKKKGKKALLGDDENAADHGFWVSPSHQSAEEAEINGVKRFYSLPSPPTAATSGRPRFPLVLALDRVLDPANLGSALRSACFLGAAAVCVSRHGGAPVASPVALKASAGAAEELLIFGTDDMVKFLRLSRKSGWRVWAAVPPPVKRGTRRAASGVDDEQNASQQQIRHVTADQLLAPSGVSPLDEAPCILLLGSEGTGLSRALRREADCEVSIPNRSATAVVDSLNVSVAAALLCQAFLGAGGVTSPAHDGNAASSSEMDDEGDEYEDDEMEEDEGSRSEVEDEKDEKLF